MTTTNTKTFTMKQARTMYRRAWTVQVTSVDPKTKRETRVRRSMTGAPGFRRWARAFSWRTNDLQPIGKLALIVAR